MLTEDGEYIPPIEGDPPCAEYDSAGAGAGVEHDGLPQCAACGHPYSAHPPQRQLVEVANEVRCSKTGKLVESEPTGERKWIILHACGEWTWEDANFCGHCGKPLTPPVEDSPCDVDDEEEKTAC